MYFKLKSIYGDNIYLLDDKNIKIIKKKSKHLSHLVDCMMLSDIETCDIDLGDNYPDIFYDIFCKTNNQGKSYNRGKKLKKLSTKIGNLSYLFLRLHMSDFLCVDDDYFVSYTKINIYNLFEDYQKYVNANRNINHIFSLSIETFLDKCLRNISDQSALQKIFSVENVIFLIENFEKSFKMLCSINPYINDCKNIFDKYEKVTIDDINNKKITRTNAQNLMKTTKILNALIFNDGMCLVYIKNQTHDVCLKAVKQNGSALMYVKNQTHDVCLEAVKQNGRALEFVKEQTDELCLEAVKQNGLALQHVKNQTDEICLEAVKQNSYALQCVIKQTEHICLEGAKQCGDVLKYVKKQTEKICMEAVKQNGFILKYVKKQTHDVCLEAVKQNGYALQYVINQTHGICLEAVKQNGYALQYVINQTHGICLEAVKQNGNALSYVQNQTREICLVAMAQNHNASEYIRKTSLFNDDDLHKSSSLFNDDDLHEIVKRMGYC
jgi:hypothetical protein